MFARPLGGAVLALAGAIRTRALPSRDAARPGARLPVVTQQPLDVRRVAARHRPARAAASRFACSSPTPCGGRSSGSGSARSARRATTRRRCASCSRSTRMRTSGSTSARSTTTEACTRSIASRGTTTSSSSASTEASACWTSAAARASWRYDIAERTGASVIAIDASPWMLEFARERFAHPRVTYVQADAVGYEPPEPVDVAVLSNVLEHIGPRVELLRALRERAGAKRLLIRVPTIDRDWTVPASPRSRTGALLRSRAPGGVHARAPVGRARRRRLEHGRAEARLGRDLGRSVSRAAGRIALRGDRATARAQTARRRGCAPRRHRQRGRQARAERHPRGLPATEARPAPSCPGCGTPIPASSPTSSTVPPLAGYTTGSPHAIASITALGHGSLTLVCSSR